MEGNPVWAISPVGVQLYFRNNRGISGLPGVRVGKRSPASGMSRSTRGSISSIGWRGNRTRKICLENFLSEGGPTKTACPLPAFCEPVRLGTQVCLATGKRNVASIIMSAPLFGSDRCESQSHASMRGSQAKGQSTSNHWPGYAC